MTHVIEWQVRTGRSEGKCHPCACGGNARTKHRLYRAWSAMRQRCSNPNADHFDRYGGRGIAVCDRWQDFDTFVADVWPSYSEGMTLERIDNDGPYAPENCRWASRKEQSQNTSVTRLITYNGETLSMREWSRRLGMGSTTLLFRLRRGWSVERAITEPVHR